MQNAIVFILRTLVDLYILTFALRLLLQWAAVDKRNPLVQFILRVTNPLVIPLRRVVPPIGRIDTATVLVLIGPAGGHHGAAGAHRLCRRAGDPADPRAGPAEPGQAGAGHLYLVDHSSTSC